MSDQYLYDRNGENLVQFRKNFQENNKQMSLVGEKNRNGKYNILEMIRNNQTINSKRYRLTDQQVMSLLSGDVVNEYDKWNNYEDSRKPVVISYDIDEVVVPIKKNNATTNARKNLNKKNNAKKISSKKKVSSKKTIPKKKVSSKQATPKKITTKKVTTSKKTTSKKRPTPKKPAKKQSKKKKTLRHTLNK